MPMAKFKIRSLIFIKGMQSVQSMQKRGKAPQNHGFTELPRSPALHTLHTSIESKSSAEPRFCEAFTQDSKILACLAALRHICNRAENRPQTHVWRRSDTSATERKTGLKPTSATYLFTLGWFYVCRIRFWVIYYWPPFLLFFSK